MTGDVVCIFGDIDKKKSIYITRVVYKNISNTACDNTAKINISTLRITVFVIWFAMLGGSVKSKINWLKNQN